MDRSYWNFKTLSIQEQAEKDGFWHDKKKFAKDAQEDAQDEDALPDNQGDAPNHAESSEEEDADATPKRPAQPKAANKLMVAPDVIGKLKTMLTSRVSKYWIQWQWNTNNAYLDFSQD